MGIMEAVMILLATLGTIVFGYNMIMLMFIGLHRVFGKEDFMKNKDNLHRKLVARLIVLGISGVIILISVLYLDYPFL